MKGMGLVLVAALTAGCQSSTAADTADLPATVTIRAAQASSDGASISLTLRNEGGEGDYVIESWGYTASVLGCRLADTTADGRCPYTRQTLLRSTSSVRVLSTYAETVVINGRSVATVVVRSRPVNTAIYRNTACKIIQNFGAAACPEP